jgi:rhamnosyltransferase
VLRHVTPTNHSATRRYYITRNRLHVWREYVRHEPAYVMVDMLNSLKELAKLVLFEDDRANKLRSVMHGVSDALRGRSGPLTDASQ